ncbi:MoxR family ATPase [Alteromonas sp. ASW11-19]|uniref:MoxR family ATPase n=1 Tax=Alteromonas salexigens TaxID=2982530 RepID=A0ABT2VKS5_9ALTE|nr:MoxR family ATPase [Alteromonas salexigens]MCU7553849.1 MoxR family ATPase [Alteromonas salexigens]
MKTEFHAVIKALSQHVIGKTDQLKLAVTCLLANGHLLIEDLPGMGKTTLSHALSDVFGMDFSRIQFTSDLLPSDMLGVNIFDTVQQQFQFRPGPVFSQLVLADEINRASPKTQSALLEAMEEQQVSIDGTTHPLPSPFFVIGTQNPGYQSGTYPLPESQLDRFLMRISLGYPSWEAEQSMLRAGSDRKTERQPALISPETLQHYQQAVAQVHCSDSVINYILRLVVHSRDEPGFPNPLSPRASKAILQSARAWALLHDRDYLVPEDVQAIFVAVTEHRLRSQQGEYADSDVLSQRLLDSVDPLAA